jgi:hypothetical protein
LTLMEIFSQDLCSISLKSRPITGMAKFQIICMFQNDFL